MYVRIYVRWKRSKQGFPFYLLTNWSYGEKPQIFFVEHVLYISQIKVELQKECWKMLLNFQYVKTKNKELESKLKEKRILINSSSFLRREKGWTWACVNLIGFHHAVTFLLISPKICFFLIFNIYLLDTFWRNFRKFPHKFKLKLKWTNDKAQWNSLNYVYFIFCPPTRRLRRY